MAEARLRKLMSEVTVTPLYERMTVEETGQRLIQHLVTKGRKASTTVGYESYLRAHLAPFFGEKPIGEMTKEDVEEFVAVCLDNDQSIKSTRNYLGFLHSVFDFALRKSWVATNPCKAIEKPELAAEDQDIRFLDQTELDALLAATAGPRSRRKPATAEWARRVRRLRDDQTMPWKRIGAELVFAHPYTGKPIDRSQLLKRFKAALRRAGVREVRFHDLRHAFGTRMAAAGVPMRTLQEWMGHRDFKTTLIYADYAPATDEAELVNAAFSARASINLSINLSETDSNSDQETPANTGEGG